MSERIITAIDLGSSKISVIIACLHENNKFEVKGVGNSESKGIENGLVRDLQKTAESISNSIEMAEEQAGFKAENFIVAISGEHIRNKNTEGRVSVAVGNQPSEIDKSHIEAVINDAKNIIKRDAGSERLEILHCIPQFYDIDTQKGIINPTGMSGFSITVHAHIILAETSHLRNIRKAFEMAELSEPTIVLGGIATAEAVTNEDERRLGCIVLDIGEGTADLMIYQNSYLKKYICVPKGGYLITNDLAIGLRTPHLSAEQVKITHGDVLPASINPDLTIVVDGIGGKPPQKKQLAFVAKIIQERLIEILDSCYKAILADCNRMDLLTAGIILTGGTSQIKNVIYLIEDENGFNLPCKLANPDLKKLSGAMSIVDCPSFSCAVGLLYYAMDHENTSSTKKKPKGNSKVLSDTGNFFKKITKKIIEL